MCDQEFIDEMPSWETMQCLDDPLTIDEMVAAMEKKKLGKIGGRTGILLELILCGGPEIWHRLLVLMKEVWKTGCVVQDWKDAEIVPYLRKEILGIVITRGESVCCMWLESYLDVYCKIGFS